MTCHYCGQPARDCDCAGEHSLEVEVLALTLDEILARQAILHAELDRMKYDRACTERQLREYGYVS